MFTLDDSGSMAAENLPDSVRFVAADVSHCRTMSTSPLVQCGGWAFVGISGRRYRIWCSPSSIRRSAARTTTRSTTIPPRPIGPQGTPTHATLPARERTRRAGHRGPPSTSTGSPAIRDQHGGDYRISSTGYPDTVWCRAGVQPPRRTSQTANTDGSVCRRNGVARTWPRLLRLPRATTTRTTRLVSALHTCNGSPYYYTISKVQYCSAKDAAGWGTSPCVAQWDATTYRYVRYGTGAATFDPQAFTRIDITPTGFRSTGFLARQSRAAEAYAQEMSNFAKWYAFYRTRMLAMKTAGGHRVLGVEREERARRFPHALRQHRSPAGSSTSRLSTPRTRTTWFSHFYSAVPDWRHAAAGRHYGASANISRTPANSGLPGAADPLDATTGMCQQNYHLLSTDGYWNRVAPRLRRRPGPDGAGPARPDPRLHPGPALSAPLSSRARRRPATPSPTSRCTTGSATSGPTSRTRFRTPSRRGSTSRSTDCRSALKEVSRIRAASMTSLPVPWIGRRPRPVHPGPIWETPRTRAIDDLWHAAVNSRGKYFNAKNPQDLAASIVQALSEFTSQSGTGTAVGIAGAQITASKNFAYRTSYEVGWWGDVRKYALDPDTGALPIDCYRQSAATRPSGLRRASSTRRRPSRLGHESPHRDASRRHQHRGAVPREPAVERSADLAHRRLGGCERDARSVSGHGARIICAATRRTKAWARRISASAPTSLATSSIRAQCPWPRPASPTTATRDTSISPLAEVAHSDGLRRRQRRNVACVQRFGRYGRGQGSLGVRAQGDVHRRRSERHRPHAFPAFQIGALSYRIYGGTHCSPQVLRQRDAAHLGRRFQRTPTPIRRRRPATTGARF